MNSTAPSSLIARMQSWLNDELKACLSPDDSLAVVDFPDHGNCGDSAIWLGEMQWLKDRFGKEPNYVCRKADFSETALRAAVPKGPIFIHGGGNFGDIWIAEQEFREAIIERFPDRRIVQFPQSLHFDSTERIDRCARAIARHKNFKLLVRDNHSKEFAEKHFDCEVRLCPDMAFAIGALRERPSHFPVLAMLREDPERVDFGAWTHADIPREDWLNESRHAVKLAKLRGAVGAGLASPLKRRYRFLNAVARYRVDRGVKQIARGRVIVTDRLHVHICATLLGRPHAVLDNSYGKIQRLMDSFYPEGTGLTYRTSSLAEAIEWARHRADAVATTRTGSGIERITTVEPETARLSR